MKILAILAPGFEETEAVTVIDILRRAAVDVTVCGLNSRQIRGSHNIVISCDTVLDDVNQFLFGGIFLPGGEPGTTNLEHDARVRQLVKNYDEQKKWLAAICAAPRVFHMAGILTGRKMTSYPAEKNIFTDAIYSEEKVVRDGHVITSRGVGTAIEFGLYLVEVLCGEQKLKEVAGKILWSP